MVDLVPVRLAEEQHGLVTRSQLRSAGMSIGAIRAMARSPHWEMLTDEVVRRRGTARTTEQKVLAAVLDSGPGAVLSHVPGAAWWGVTGCSLTPIEVSRTTSSRRRTELARIHKVRELPERWTTELRKVPIARPELIALHLFAVCSEGRAERLVERMWSMRLLSGRSIAAFLGELGRRGRNGTAGLRRYLEQRGADYVPPASGLEARALQLFRQAGLDMRPQVDSGGDHWVGRVDFRHAQLPLIAEIQSEPYHSALLDRQTDRRRLQALRSAGFTVIELTDEQVWSRPWEVALILDAAVRTQALTPPVLRCRTVPLGAVLHRRTGYELGQLDSWLPDSARVFAHR